MTSTSLTPRRIAGATFAWILILLSGCGGGGTGGGGSSGFIPPPEGMRDGLRGAIVEPDLFMGRITEQEPNDSAGQPFHVAPLFARNTAEIAGTVGETDEAYGAVDASDVLRLRNLSDQVVQLNLTWTELDPVGGAANDVQAEVRLTSTNALVDTFVVSGATSSVSVSFMAGVQHDVIITAVSGHAAYVLEIVCSDPVAPSVARDVDANVASSVSRAKVPNRAASVFSQEPEPSLARCATHHVLVKFHASCDPAAFCSSRTLALLRRIGTGSYVVGIQNEGVGVKEREARVASLCNELTMLSGDVVHAEPDWTLRPFALSDDAMLHRQHGLRQVGTFPAWDITTGDSSVVVAVIDSGITSHVDLNGQTVSGYDFISNPARAADGNGRDADPTDEGDQISSSGLSTWHGTNTASLIAAASNNGVGIAGVAPGVKVMPLRVIGGGGGTTSDTVDAILFAAGILQTADGTKLSEPVDVINLSLGSNALSSDLRDACNQAVAAGVIVVAASGNDGGSVDFPAAFASVIAVGATDETYAVTSYSSRGPEVDLVAPGGRFSPDTGNDGWCDAVLSASPDATLEPQVPSWIATSGTSLSAPLVAGAAALLRSLDGSVSPADARSYLRLSALDIGTAGRDDVAGSGVLQVHRALEALLDDAGTPHAAPAALRLESSAMALEGYVGTRDLIMFNDGTDRLELLSAVATTDDGAAWLVASVEDSDVAGDISHHVLRISVDTNELPASPSGRFSGVVTVIGGPSDVVLAHVRVTLLGDDPVRLGQRIEVGLTSSTTTAVIRRTRAMPDQGYRFWFRNMASGPYRVFAAEDSNQDGVIGGAAEARGWYGGPLSADALVVDYILGDPPVEDLNITLELPAP